MADGHKESRNIQQSDSAEGAVQWLAKTLPDVVSPHPEHLQDHDLQDCLEARRENRWH